MKSQIIHSDTSSLTTLVPHTGLVRPEFRAHKMQWSKLRVLILFKMNHLGFTRAGNHQTKIPWLEHIILY